MESPARPGGACCVCDRPVARAVHTLGGRDYCPEHFARVTLGSRGTWPAVAALVLGMAAFGLLMQVVGPGLDRALDDGGRIAAGLVLAGVPAAVWLLVFRRLDRLEPEPRRHLLGVLGLAALLTAAVAEPIRREGFGMNRWQAADWPVSLLVHVLVDGVLLATTVYLAVRWTVFRSAEFDERADGIIYGTAAGLGAAIPFNLGYVLDHDGVRLDVGAARMIVAALAYAAAGGLAGYGLGQVKFEPHPAWFAPSFVLLAALLTGGFNWLVEVATVGAADGAAWLGLPIAAAFAAAVLGAVYALLRRAVAETLALGSAAGTAEG